MLTKNLLDNDYPHFHGREKISCSILSRMFKKSVPHKFQKKKMMDSLKPAGVK
jgi:hypothetical protein